MASDDHNVQTPPVASEGSGAEQPAVLSCRTLPVLQERRDFLAAARARKHGTAGFLVQMRNRQDGDPITRVGFTCSKKVGNAVMRNRAKRRLRALAREILSPLALPGHDYVLIGKPGATTTRPYADLITDLQQAITRLHQT